MALALMRMGRCLGRILAVAVIFGPTLANAVEPIADAFQSQLEAALLDDRCRILGADRRKAIDGYRAGLERALTAADPAFLAMTRPETAKRAAHRAATFDCAKARVVVRDAYEEAVAAAAAAKTAPLTVGMSAGKRCHVISEEETDRLLAAWRRRAATVAARYNVRIRMKYVMREDAYEDEAARIPCERARQAVETALTLAGDAAR